MIEIDGTTPILPDAEMQALRFTDRSPEYWYYCKRVDGNTTLNFSINKVTGHYTETVLNEFFGQPEYYGRMKPEVRDQILFNIDTTINELNNAGLTLAVDHTLYGCEPEEKE